MKRILIILTIILLISCNNKKGELKYPVYTDISNADIIVGKIDSILQNLDSLLFSDSCTMLMASNKPDLMRCISSLKHISVDSGFILDYIYDCGNEFPTVYLRSDSENPIENYNDLKSKYSYKEIDCIEKTNEISELIDRLLSADTLNKRSKDDSSKSLSGSLKDTCREIKIENMRRFIDKIESDCFSKLSCDGTAEGIYTLSIYRYLYNRFGLRWHFIPSRRHVIYSVVDGKDKIERYRDVMNNERIKDCIQSLDSLDFRSTVMFLKDTIMINYICFSPGKGVFSRVEKMNSNAPYSIYERSDSVITEGGIGVMF